MTNSRVPAPAASQGLPVSNPGFFQNSPYQRRLLAEIKDSVKLGLAEVKNLAWTRVGASPLRQPARTENLVWPGRTGSVIAVREFGALSTKAPSAKDRIRVIDRAGRELFKVEDPSFFATGASMSENGEVLISGRRKLNTPEYETESEALYFDAKGVRKGAVKFEGKGMEISPTGEFAIVTGHRFSETAEGVFQVFHLGSEPTEFSINLPHDMHGFAAAFVGKYQVLLLDLSESPAAYIFDLEKGGNPVASALMVTPEGAPYQFNLMKVDAVTGPSADRIFLLAMDPAKASSGLPNSLLAVNSALEVKAFSEGNLVNSFAVSEASVVLNQWKYGWKSDDVVNAYEDNKFEIVILDHGLAQINGRQPHIGNHVTLATEVKGQTLLDFDNDLAGGMVWTKGSGFARKAVRESILDARKHGVWITKDKIDGSIHIKQEAGK